MNETINIIEYRYGGLGDTLKELQGRGVITPAELDILLFDLWLSAITKIFEDDNQ